MDDTPPQSSRYCLDCGYALRGLIENQCPECGRFFDPQNPKTTAAHPERETRRVLEQAGRTFTLALAIAAGSALFASALGFYTSLFVAVVLLIIPMMLLFLVTVLNPWAPLSPRRRFAGIACAALLASIVWTEWPFRLMFELHRPALNRAMARVRAGEIQTEAGPLWVGVWRFRVVRTHTNGNLGFQLSGSDGGGVFLVNQWRAGGWIWYNTNWTEDLGGGWFRAYED